MRLLFEDVSGKTGRYSITDSNWFPPAAECSVIAATATLSVSRQDHETLILEGGIKGRCKVVCDRCGEPYIENLESEFYYLVTTRKEDAVKAAEQECSDEDALTLYLTEPIIEVDEILKEQALLAVPQKNVCSEDCKGVCASCGVVLNKEPCRCEPKTPPSPFAVLKKMKNQ